MARTVASIKAVLTALGFQPETGSQDWVAEVGGYAVRVNMASNTARVDYGSAIRRDRDTTLDLLAGDENLVVLECVLRLLRQGYVPAALTLEKSFPLGRSGGFLDILVEDSNGQAFLMVECKSWDEYSEDVAGTPVRQLVSYLHQDQEAKVGCVYASRVVRGQVEIHSLVLDNAILGAGRNKNIPAAILAGRSLFEEAPYAKPEQYLRAQDLKPLGADSSSTIFNGFMEILRRYAVSDKPNAFNKIFNLFICKIWDEEKQGETRLGFQWSPDETAETVLGRLNALYRGGVNQFLRMEVVDHDWQEVLKKLPANNKPGDLDAVEKIFTDLRLYKNNEFGFYEVYDEKTFRENALIVRDVVQLLQKYRLRYDQKHQFLGDFFERLLGTSVKQEAGQFFTPLPVARFICDALPFERVIDQKIQDGVVSFLPNMIDYAAGSGHFLTEGMDRVDRLLKERVQSGALKGRQQKQNGAKWSTGYQWASEFVYGIEKDYRLAKTAKISCFLNGDGDANLIRANGLDHFAHSEEYRDAPALWLNEDKAKNNGRDNPAFDVVIANPPYSVDQYKQTVPHGAESFELWPLVGEDNKSIECLFLERTKHLLRPGGVAGVVFPSSILNNDGLAAAARSILLKYFEIVGIVHLGGGTFMATNVSTATLFLRRRDNDHWRQCQGLVDHFLATGQDTTIDGVEQIFAAYAQDVRGLSLADYVQAVKTADGSAPFLATLRAAFRAPKISKTQAKILTEAQVATQIQAAFQAFVHEQEASRLLDFALTRSQRTVFVKAPSGNDEEAAFLGYKFSERRGYEGLVKVNPNAADQVDGDLYNEQLAHDPNRVAGVLHAAFSGEFQVPSSLVGTTRIVNLASLIKFDRASYIAEIGTPSSALVSGGVPISNLFSVRESSVSPRQSSPSSMVNLVEMESIEVGTGRGMPIQKVGGKITGKRSVFKRGDVLYGALRPNLNKVWVADVDGLCSPEFFVLTPCGSPFVLKEILMSELVVASATGLVKGSGLPRISLVDFLALQVPSQAKFSTDWHGLRARRLRAVAEGRQRQADAAYQKSLAIVDGPLVPLSSLVSVVADRTKPAANPDTLVNLVEMEHIEADTGKGKAIQKSGGKINGVRSVFQKGDVLYGKIRPYLNKVWVADVNGVCATSIAVFRPTTPGTGPLVASVMSRIGFVSEAKEKSTGATMPTVKEETVLAFQVADPTSKLDQHTASIANLTVQRAALEDKANDAKNRLGAFLKSSLGL